MNAGILNIEPFRKRKKEDIMKTRDTEMLLTVILMPNGILTDMYRILITILFGVLMPIYTFAGYDGRLVDDQYHISLLKTDDIHPPKRGYPFTFYAFYLNGDAKLVIFSVFSLI